MSVHRISAGAEALDAVQQRPIRAQHALGFVAFTCEIAGWADSIV
jgi:hypothetical protein